MKNYKLFFLLSVILILFSSCGTIKEGFSNQKKNSSDEFMVEKKSPLVMPPDFNKLPTPEENNVTKNNEIKDLISKTKKDSTDSDNSNNNDENFEKSLIEKIKKN